MLVADGDVRSRLFGGTVTVLVDGAVRLVGRDAGAPAAAARHAGVLGDRMDGRS